MADNDNQSTNDEVRPPPRPRGNRGKGSSDRRQANKRKDENIKAMNTLEDLFRSQLFLTDLNTFSTSQFQESSGITGSKIVPVSTRALGFHSSALIARVDEANYIDRPVCDANVAYRSSLVLANNTLAKVRSPIVLTGLPPVIPPAKIATPAPPQCLTTPALGSTIMSIGNITITGDKYAAYIPPYRTRIEQQFADAIDGAQRRRLPDVLTTMVNPYYVTARNLRDTVNLLANPAYPVDLRRDFHDRNPFPNAIWGADHLLINPDQICPPNFLMAGDNTVYNDFIAFHGLMTFLKARNPRFVVDISTAIEGSGSILHSHFTRGAFRLDGPQFEYCNETSVYQLTAEVNKSAVEKQRAASDLLGEVPFFPNNNARNEFDDIMHLRQIAVQHSYYSGNWQTLSLSNAHI